MKALPRDRGAALVLVVVVIAALVAIATPFAVSMRLHEKSARGFAARVRARRLAEAARNDALAALMTTHPDEERRARLDRQDLQQDDEDWDSFDELHPRPRDLTGRVTLTARSSHANVDGTGGTILDTEVKDERAKIDLNACGADVVSNLLGATVLTEPLDYDTTDAVYVEDIRPFFSDGDPSTIDGTVWVDNEAIWYRGAKPADGQHSAALTGLTRRVYFTGTPPPEDPSKKKDWHKTGSLLRDARGLKVCRDAVWRWVGTDRENEAARFETPTAVRKIADWEYSTFAFAALLSQNGVTFEKLREWGIVQEKLDLSGLDQVDLDVQKARAREDDKARKKREDAEKGLQKLGVDPGLIRRYGGDHAVERAWTLIQSVDDPEQQGVANGIKDRYEKLASAPEGKHEAWLRGEVKEQLDQLIAFREKTPEVETISRIEMERIRPFVTVDAGPEGELWTDPQVVNHDVRYDPFARFAVLQIQDARRFRYRALVRVQPRRNPAEPVPPGTPVQMGPAEYREVRQIIHKGDHTEIHLFPQLERDYLASTLEVSVLQPKPVNVNAAPREVLVAVLTGLQTPLFQKASATGDTAANFVTPAEADLIATRILQASAPIKNLQDLKRILDDAKEAQEIDQGDEEAILRNAVDPADPLVSRSTVPFSFASGDVYEVIASGVVNDPASNEVARVRTREVCQVAPPRDLVWHLDTQDAFTDRLATNGPLTDKNDPRSWQKTFLAGKWSNLLDSFPQDLFFQPWLRPDRVHSQTGQVKLALSREYPLLPRGKPGLMGNDGTPGVLKLETFDLEHDGHDLAQGPFALSGTDLPQRSFAIEDGSLRTHLGPGTVRAWFKVDKLGGANTYFYDLGHAQTRDRLTLYYDAAASALVAKVKDESLDFLETGGQPRSNAEVRFPWKPQPGNWYHLALAWKGAEPGDLALLVDGKPVGTEQMGTRTTSPVSATASVIEVESTAGFPPQGYIRVGGFRGKDTLLIGDSYTSVLAKPPWTDWEPFTEVLYYASKTPTAFLLVPDTTWWDELLQHRHPDQAISPGMYPPPAHVPSRRTGRFQVVNDPVDNSQMEMRLGLAHDKGTPVTLWGYTQFLKNGPNWNETITVRGQTVTLPPKLPAYQETLHTGGATLMEPLAENTPFSLVFANHPAGWNATTNPCPKVVDPGAKDIPVVWADGAAQGGFPQSGFLRVGNERVFYRGIGPSPTGGMMFLNCDRGLDGTTDDTHYLWEPVVLESIRVSRDDDYWPETQFMTTPAGPTLVDPCVYVQLTPTITLAQHQAVADPRQPPLVEWVRVLRSPAQQYSPIMVLPALTPGRINQQSKEALAPGERFVLLPPLAGAAPARLGQIEGWIRALIRGRGDTRWIGAYAQISVPGLGGGKLPGGGGNPGGGNQGGQPDGLLGIFAKNNGSLPGNGPYDNLAVFAPQQAFGAPKGQLPPPPLPATTQPLKQWLTHVEANDSRTAKGTFCDKSRIWNAQKNPTGTSAHGGRPHTIGEKIVPTFVTGPLHPNDSGHFGYDGKGDTVTITDDVLGDTSREEHTITWSAGAGPWTNDPNFGPTLTNNDFGAGEIVALDDFVSRPFLATQHARLVKYPSGQLPWNPQQISVATARPQGPGDPVADGPGTLGGRVDEVVTTQENEPIHWEIYVRGAHQGNNVTDWPKGAKAAWPQPVTGLAANATMYDSCLQGEIKPQSLIGGVTIKLDDELLGIQDLGPGVNGQGLMVVRGMLASAAVQHGSEAPFWFDFPFPKLVVAQTQLMEPKRADFTLRPGASQHLRDHDFYLAVDRGQGQGILEMLPIKNRQGDRLFLPRDQYDRGAFRGAFGSGIANPEILPRELLFDFPFRYIDRYAPRVSSIEGVFFEATKELPGAFFESITWEADHPNPYTKVVIAVRVDGTPGWDDEPSKPSEPGQKGRLYLFDDPKEANKILLKGDKVEVRAYLTFKPQAFLPGAVPEGEWKGDGWKQTPVLRAIRLTYRQPTRIRRREELMD